MSPDRPTVGAATALRAWPVWTMLAVGLLLLLLALVGFLRTELFVHRAVLVQGTLEALHSPDGRTGTAFHFYTREGQQVRVVSAVTTQATGMPSPGDTIPVYYDPANPQDARVALWAWLWLWPTVLGGIGGVFLLVLLVGNRLTRG